MRGQIDSVDLVRGRFRSLKHYCPKPPLQGDDNLENMGLRIWRFSSILSTAVAMSAAFAHLMELPAKRRWDPHLYVKLHRTLYPNFGKIAGPFEAIAVLAAGSLAWYLHRRRSDSFPLTVGAAAALAAAHGIFWRLVQPANTTM